MRYLGVILFLHLIAACGVASEIIVKTDSLPPASSHRINEVSAGTRFATLLTAPVDGTIVGVQILWGSIGGIGAPSQEAAIRVSSFAGNNYYVPAVTLATITSPILQDGIVNEYRFLNPASNTIPLAVPIASGTKFFVDLEIANAHGYTGPGVIPCLLMDANGTQGINSIFINGHWLPYSVAVSGGGDLGIRVIVATIPEPSTITLATLAFVVLVVACRKGQR